MPNFDIDGELVRKLAALLEETGLTEIEYASGDQRVRVARGGIVTSVPGIPAHSVADTETTSPAASTAEAGEAAHPGAVTAPMVGVAYLAPEPGAEHFIKLGDTVSEGQTLLLIEAMKTFNPIRAPQAGIVRQILIADSSPVEYGEALVILEQS